MNYIRNILFCSISLLAALSLSGQQAMLKLLDKKTNEPVLYAHVCFESLENKQQLHALTDDKGETANLAESKSVVAISYIGYETLYDTIQPGQSVTLFLEPVMYSMNELVVTAQYTPQRVDQSIYKVQVIGAKKIDQKGANNLAELFSSELSMQINQDGALGSNLNIRGLGGEHVKFLIDGVPMIGRLNGNIDLGQINLANVDHIEVIEGPMSVVYGSNALAGVINIITRENKNTNLQASASSYVESVGVFNFDGSTSIKKGRNIFSISGGRNFFNGYSEVDTSRSKQWKPKRQYFAEGYYVYSHKSFKIKFNSRYFNEMLFNKGDLKYPYYETASDNIFRTIRFTNSLDTRTKIGPDRYLQVLLSYADYDRIREDYFKNLTNLENYLQNRDTTQFNDISLRTVMSKSVDSAFYNYQMGIEMHRELGHGEKIDGGIQQISDFAAFFSLKLEPTKKLLFQPGVRFIYNTRFEAPFIYSLNAKWQVHPEIQFRASYSRGFRAPSLKELYLDFEDVNHDIKGNPDLQAENSHNVSFSGGWMKEKDKKQYGIDADLFYNQIYNLIQLVPLIGGTPTRPPYTYTNVGNFISQGVQFDLNYGIYPRIKIKTGMTYTGRQYTLENNEEVPSMLYSTDLNANVDYRIIKYDLDVVVFYKYTGRYPDYGIDSNTGDWVEGYRKDYHTMDISLNKNFFENSLKCTLGVKNLFNNTSIQGFGNSGTAHSGGGDYMIGWGRTYFVNLTYTLNRYN